MFTIRFSHMYRSCFFLQLLQGNNASGVVESFELLILDFIESTKKWVDFLWFEKKKTRWPFEGYLNFLSMFENSKKKKKLFFFCNFHSSNHFPVKQSLTFKKHFAKAMSVKITSISLFKLVKLGIFFKIDQNNWNYTNMQSIARRPHTNNTNRQTKNFFNKFKTSKF